MSSKDNDPPEKQDTSSKSSDSNPDSEVNIPYENLDEEDVNEAEKDLEHLELQEHLTKEEQKSDSVESNPMYSPIQGKTKPGKCVAKSEPVVGSSGFKEFHLPTTDVKSDPVPKALGISCLQKEKNIGNKGTEFMRSDSDTTKSTSPFIQSSPTTSSERVVAPPIPERRSLKYLRYLDSNLKTQSVQSGSANTSLDVPEIVSEIASDSREGSAHREDIGRDQSPGCLPDMIRQRSEASDANLSEIQDEYLPPLPTPTSSISTSTSSREYGDRHKEARFQKKAGERQVQSLGNLSPEQSEVPNVSELGLVGDEGFYRRNVDISDSSFQDFPDQLSEDIRPASEPLEALLLRREIDKERLSEGETEDEEIKEESHLLADVESVAIDVQKVEQKMIPSHRKKPSKHAPGSSSMEKGEDNRFHRRGKPYIEKKSKMAAGKSKDFLESSSESPEPKSTSSSLRGESLEISSSESSRSQTSKKEWQKPGQLYKRRYSTMSSIDSIISEEADLNPPSKDSSPESMETGEKNESPEKMEATGDEGAAAESKSVFKSSDQTSLSEQVGAKGGDRKPGKCKRRGAKLSNSPPSDEMPSYSPKKVRKIPRTSQDDESESESSEYLFVQGSHSSESLDSSVEETSL